MRGLAAAAASSVVFSVIIVVTLWDQARYRMPEDPTGYEPVQPVAYSHELHAGDFRIPCELCHYAAPKGRFAGIPDAATCMKCHADIKPESPEVQKVARAVETGEPIAWTRVIDLPDFVYFDHSRHVGSGVACQTCHGPVETMERVRQVRRMSMGWCVECHRQYDREPPEGFEHVAPSVECSVCHY